MGAYLLGVIIYLLVFSLFEIFCSKRWGLVEMIPRALFWPLTLLSMVILGYVTGLQIRDKLEDK